MMLLIMRHGKAEEKRPGIRDEERRLTEKGRKDVEHVAKIMPFKPSKIYSSPMLRAIETAEIISRIYNVNYEVLAELLPEKLSINALKKLKLEENTLLIGHAPSIEELISGLIGGGKVKLKAGAIAGLEIEELASGGAKLVFLITPQVASSFS